MKEGRRAPAARARCGLLTLLLLALLTPAAARAELIDRVLAVVEGQLITLSDVRAVTLLGVETVPPGPDQIRGALDKLIDRQLMLVEVDRYGPPEPAPSTIEAGVQVVRGRFRDVLEFETTLHRIGLTLEHLRRYVRDSLRIESYLQQRFTAAIQPSEDEIGAYYRQHAQDFAGAGTPRPYDEVRSEVRRRLIEERRATLVREWLGGLRRRANLVDLYLTSPSPRSGTATRT